MAGTACQQRLEAASDSTSPVGDAGREEHPLLSWLFVFFTLAKTPAHNSGTTHIKCVSSHLSEPQLVALLEDSGPHQVDYPDQLLGS